MRQKKGGGGRKSTEYLRTFTSDRGVFKDFQGKDMATKYNAVKFPLDAFETPQSKGTTTMLKSSASL